MIASIAVLIFLSYKFEAINIMGLLAVRVRLHKHLAESDIGIDHEAGLSIILFYSYAVIFCIIAICGKTGSSEPVTGIEGKSSIW